MNLEGGCSCGSVRYALTEKPLIVHACHCRDCQRLTGSSFITNIWIEREHVQLQSGSLSSFRRTTDSGNPHELFFCAACATHIWGKYHASPGDTLFVRVGTLDDPTAVRPDVHIFTRSKVPWLSLPTDVPSFEVFYDPRQFWSPDTRARFRANIEKHASQQA
ncbi:MAG TPA: GFA family protein [Povalibacter sp.]|nr:GFA family protein [Povalibacter sp.]